MINIKKSTMRTLFIMEMTLYLNQFAHDFMMDTF